LKASPLDYLPLDPESVAMCEAIAIIVGCHYSNAERNSIIIRILNAFQWAFILMYFPSIALSHRGKIRLVRNTFPIPVSSLTVTGTPVNT